MPTSSSQIHDQFLQILPACAVGEATLGALWDVTLPPEEFELVVDATPRRKREFAAARNCARRALAKLGVLPRPILSGPNGEPVWPAGIVGSITHCPGFCASAVAHQWQLLGIGIDTELNAALPQGVQTLVCTSEELRELRRQLPAAAEMGIHLDALIFSAKESLYKAWYPIAKSYLEFDNVVVHFDIQHKKLYPRLKLETLYTVKARRINFRGRFGATKKYIFTSVVAEAVGSEDDDIADY